MREDVKSQACWGYSQDPLSIIYAVTCGSLTVGWKKEKGVSGGDRLFSYIKLIAQLLVHIPWRVDISFYVSFSGQKSMLN